MDTFNIANRRYLGSKQQLLDFIENIVKSHTKNCHSFADIFAGSGVVANRFNKNYNLILNDNLTCNYHIYTCFFSNVAYDKDKILTLLESYNNAKNLAPNYYSKNFTNTYLSEENLKIVGFIRDNIELNLEQNIINKREHSILITSLLYAIDRIANTVGHYDSYRKNGDLEKKLNLRIPLIDNSLNANNQIYCRDANDIAKKIKADIFYLDPPYNSRQYCDAYHFLENVAKNTKPQVVGVAKKMDRSGLKSNYCLSDASVYLSELVANINAKYILLSYNNTHNKANARSNAKISDNEILEILGKKGKVRIFEKDFAPFNAGKSNITNHKERIFLCEVR